MANYRAIVRRFPAVLDYLRTVKWVRRGDVQAYQPNLSCPSFSTDQLGFRPTLFDGAELSLAGADRLPRFGLILGSSHIFGFGLSANGQTLASHLSNLVGFPFFAVSYPEADSRTLCATLLRVLCDFGDRVSHVILVPGGDFTRFCYVGYADPLFGPPMLTDGQNAAGAPAQPPRRDFEFERITQFRRFWTKQCFEATSRAGAEFLILEDATIFEKTTRDPIEIDCDLGVPHSAIQRIRFDAHKRHSIAGLPAEHAFALAQGMRLAPFPPADKLLFIDEYHYRDETQALIARALAPAIA